jgi:hypothetical protein
MLGRRLVSCLVQRGFIPRNAEIIYVLQRCLQRQMWYFWQTFITYVRTRCGRTRPANVKVFMAFGQPNRAVISGQKSTRAVYDVR